MIVLSLFLAMAMFIKWYSYQLKPPEIKTGFKVLCTSCESLKSFPKVGPIPGGPGQKEGGGLHCHCHLWPWAPATAEFHQFVACPAICGCPYLKRCQSLQGNGEDLHNFKLHISYLCSQVFLPFPSYEGFFPLWSGPAWWFFSSPQLHISPP